MHTPDIRSTMRTLPKLIILFGIFAISHAAETGDLEAFIEDIIETWQLRSPTILVKDVVPKMCMTRQWLLCLSIDQDTNEFANHLASVHQHRKQDGIIFAGSQGHLNLLKHLDEVAPSLLISNYPVFLPISYQNDIKLRLDSNIIFYRENDNRNYELYDIFAVKGGPSIKLEVGKWSFDDGIILSKSMNRWDRRTNLEGTKFVNCFANNRLWASFTMDKNGNINGSKGYIQDMLFYVTDNLNLTIETTKAEWVNKLLENGSWTNGLGFLQRQEVDVVSTSIGINLQRSYYIDYPIPTRRGIITLLAAIPKGASPNMWVYVRVFGVSQWMIFIVFLVLMAIGLSVINALTEDQSGREFGSKSGSRKDYHLDSVPSALAMACLYAIQMGSHTDSKKLTTRLLTLTMSILTLLFFVFYTGDITAAMTSGPPDIPVRNFEDVVFHNYKVVAVSAYYEKKLANSEPSSAKHEVHKSNFELLKSEGEEYAGEKAITAVVNDPDAKTLMYSTPETLSGHTTPHRKALTDQMFALKMDDAVYSIATLALQKDSEFLQIFNHYILKAFEGGEFKRLYRRYHMDLFIKDNFEMVEPQPLGPNNVMFCFIALGLGICLSLISAMIELLKMKICKQHPREDRAGMAINSEEKSERDQKGKVGNRQELTKGALNVKEMEIEI